MAKNYTNRGSQWEWLNSWWVLLTFLPFGITSFLAFLYIGYRVKYPRWRIFGFIYLVALIVAFVTTNNGVGAFIAFSSWVISIFHAIKTRPAYLVQLDVLMEQQPMLEQEKISKLRKEAAKRFSHGEQEDTIPPRKKQTLEMKNPPYQRNLSQTPTFESVTEGNKEALEVEKIDINTATEAEIASIPEIGVILAKKVVSMRQELGGFASFEQFVQIIGLKEHTIEKIRQRVEFSKLEPTSNERRSGRLIDF